METLLPFSTEARCVGIVAGGCMFEFALPGLTLGGAPNHFKYANQTKHDRATASQVLAAMKPPPFLWYWIKAAPTKRPTAQQTSKDESACPHNIVLTERFLRILRTSGNKSAAEVQAKLPKTLPPQANEWLCSGIL
jgi:hypothetical protein